MDFFFVRLIRFEDTHSNLFVFRSRYNNKVGWWQFSPPPTIVEDLTRRRVYWLTITSSEWSGLTPREVICKQSTVPNLPCVWLTIPAFNWYSQNSLSLESVISTTGSCVIEHPEWQRGEFPFVYFLKWKQRILLVFYF